MKIFSTLLFALSLAAPTAHCQLTYGLKIGGNCSTLHLLAYNYPSAYDYSWDIGAQGGMVFDWYLDDWASLQFDALIGVRRMGFSALTDEVSENVLALSRLSTQAFLRLTPFRGVSGLIGGGFDFRFSDAQAPFLNAREPYELSIGCGLAARVTDHLRLEMRYLHGLMPAALAPAAPSDFNANTIVRPSASAQRAYGRSAQVSAVYFFQKN